MMFYYRNIASPNYISEVQVLLAQSQHCVHPLAAGTSLILVQMNNYLEGQHQNMEVGYWCMYVHT